MAEIDQTTPTIDGPDITNYWQYFGLERDPFSMSFDESLIYLSPKWEEMLDLVQYLVHYKNQLVVITGGPGSGKSTFDDIFTAQLGETAHIVKLGAEPNLDVLRLVEFLSDAFTLPWTPNQNVEEVLDEQLLAFQTKEKDCILLLDNAHLLPQETLEALLYLIGQQSENQMRLHVILLGEPQLTQMIHGILEEGDEELVHFLTLEPLSLEETQNYLSYRLSSAGWQEENPMNEETTERVFKLSEGNPARINRIARRFLVDMLHTRQQHDEKPSLKSLLPRIVGICVIGLLIVVAGFWYWSSNTEEKETSSDSHPNISLNGQPVANEIKQGQPVELHPAVSTNSTNASVPVNVADVKAASASNEAEPKTPAAVNLTDASSPAAALPVKVSDEAAPAQLTSTSAKEATVRTAEEAKISVAKNETAKSKIDTTKMNKDFASNETTKKPKVKTPAKTIPLAANNATGNYTIQLIGLTNHAALSKFIKDNHLEGKVTTKVITKQGKKITIVLYGHYKSMREAEQAITILPPSLMKAGPWPRKIPE